MTDPAGREVPITWRGHRMRAFVPALLADRDLTLERRTVATAASAAADVRHAAAQQSSDAESLLRLTLRAEGVGSSFIEGVRAPLVEVVLAEEHLPGCTQAAAWVAANLATVARAIESAPETTMTAEVLCDWHRSLMTGGPVPERYIGVVRNEQGWIGGNDPTDAHLVTPPPEELGRLLDDLVRYVNDSGVESVVQAAIAHAQFEHVHPFADGNGRIGRVLVAWILAKRLSLVIPPPVSAAIAMDVGGYTSGLTLYRMGEHDRWVRWFAGAVSSGARAQESLIASLDSLQVEWRRRLADRSGRTLRADAAAWRVLRLLPRHPLITSNVVVSQLGVTNKAALSALRQLAQAGVLHEYGTVARRRGQPAKLYVSTELLGLAGSSPMR